MSSRPLVFCGILFLLLFATTASQAQGTITSITPMSGVAGTQITITGQGLHPNWVGMIDCTINGLGSAIPSVWTDTQIVVTIPSNLPGNTTTIPVAVYCWDEWADQYSNAVNWTILQPIISSIIPNTGLPNSDVTISGSGFGAVQGSSTVAFKNATAVAKSWSDTQIVVTVPLAAQTGAIVVSIPDMSPSNSPAFYVMPHIDSLSPSSGMVGTQITVAGQSLYPQCSEFGVFFGSVSAPIVSWTSTEIVATVPPGLPAGVTTFPVHVNSWDDWDCTTGTNSLMFTLLSGPSLTSLSSSTLIPGMQLTLTGSGFGATQGTGHVYLGDAANNIAPVLSWNDTEIVVFVPFGTVGGNAFVSQSGLLSNGIAYTMATPPVVSGVFPNSGPPGLRVTIFGSSFGATRGIGQVRLGGAYPEVISWADSQIVILVPGNANSGSIQVSQGGVASNGIDFNIVSPVITSVTPDSGVAGAQVVVLGSGFGELQGNAALWLGSTYGVITSWSESQIVASVAPSSSSGTVQVVRYGYSSNSLPFTIATPQVISVSPNPAAPGDAITITGTGFGSEQGSGTVWLGSANGSVTSWSDTQITATAAAAAISGTAQVLQNGVQTEPVPFSIRNPHIASMNPVSGPAGTSVTISGSGFEANQGAGAVTIAGSSASIVSWSDTEIVIQVASGTRTGVVRVAQSGRTSNASTFIVSGTWGTGGSLQISPSMASLLVGETREFQALDENGNEIDDLTWSVSDSSIATLSTDNPPVLTAIAPGTVTITAGEATAEITIYDGFSLPEGTVKWSVPGDGSGVLSILPAVPSSEGVADVFALQNSGNVQAITADGKVVWTKPIAPEANLIPDFQGGLLMAGSQSITKLDGKTGQAYPSYQLQHPFTDPDMPGIRPSTVVHPDGTIFTVDGDDIVGIDPKTGQMKFSIALEHSTWESKGEPPISGFCPMSTNPVVQTGNNVLAGGSMLSYVAGLYADPDMPPTVGNLIIAGDGYAYAAYHFQTAHSYSGACDDPHAHHSLHQEVTLKLVRVDSSGNASRIPVKTWTYDKNDDIVTGEVPSLIVTADLITNADKGVLLSWTDTTTSRAHTHLTTTSNGDVSESSLNLPKMITPDYSGAEPVRPILQRSDGTFIGTAMQYSTSYQPSSHMVAFDWNGNVKWTVPDAYPSMATSDGGVVAWLWDGGTVLVDSNGKVESQVPSVPTLSFKGAYQLGSTKSLEVTPPILDSSFAAVQNASLLGNGFSLIHRTFGIVFCGSDPGDGSCVFSEEPEKNSEPVRFTYQKRGDSDYYNPNSQQTYDFTGTHTNWVNAVKAWAFNAYKAGFSKLPVIVKRGDQTTDLFGGRTFEGTKDPQFDHTVYVTGYWVGFVPAEPYSVAAQGQTPSNRWSRAYYLSAMAGAQHYLGKDHDLSPDYSSGSESDFLRLMKGIGIGLGNIAVHETGHQLSFAIPDVPIEFRVVGMDCGGSDYTPCESTEVPFFEVHSAKEYQYKELAPTIHWQRSSECSLTRYLLNNKNAKCD